ncbi:MAG: hypothetical protein ACRD50_01740 [Candidatus Acidiferrales bacterium]
MSATNSEAPVKTSRRLRLAGAMVIAGLLVELFSLIGNRPLDFLAFFFGGGLLMAAGIVLYLYSLASLPVSPDRL